MIWFNVTPTPRCQKVNRGRQWDMGGTQGLKTEYLGTISGPLPWMITIRFAPVWRIGCCTTYAWRYPVVARSRPSSACAAPSAPTPAARRWGTSSTSENETFSSQNLRKMQITPLTKKWPLTNYLYTVISFKFMDSLSRNSRKVFWIFFADGTINN